MSDVSRRGPLRRAINRLEVDQAVFYSLCLRMWQFVVGPVTVFLIGTYFSPDVQGYFYTFGSLMALQSFFELGLHVAIVNIASHEWVGLELDEEGQITGDPAARSRLVSLGRLLFAWYGAAALLFALAVGFGGAWFLGRKDYGPIDWEAPWAALVVLSAGVLWNLPFIVLLEGCGQLAIVNRYRAFQGITGSLAVWTCVVLGLGLWAAVVATGVQVVWSLLLLGALPRLLSRLSPRTSRTASQLAYRPLADAVASGREQHRQLLRVQFADPGHVQLPRTGGGWPNGDDLAAGHAAAGDGADVGSGARTAVRPACGPAGLSRTGSGLLPTDAYLLGSGLCGRRRDLVGRVGHVRHPVPAGHPIPRTAAHRDLPAGDPGRQFPQLHGVLRAGVQAGAAAGGQRRVERPDWCRGMVVWSVVRTFGNGLGLSGRDRVYQTPVADPDLVAIPSSTQGPSG